MGNLNDCKPEHTLQEKDDLPYPPSPLPTERCKLGYSTGPLFPADAFSSAEPPPLSIHSPRTGKKVHPAFPISILLIAYLLPPHAGHSWFMHPRMFPSGSTLPLLMVAEVATFPLGGGFSSLRWSVCHHTPSWLGKQWERSQEERLGSLSYPL